MLDLFFGMGSVLKHSLSNPETYAEPVSVDILKKCKATITSDIIQLDYKALWQPGDFDIVWTSPPCTHYSGLGCLLCLPAERPSYPELTTSSPLAVGVCCPYSLPHLPACMQCDLL